MNYRRILFSEKDKTLSLASLYAMLMKWLFKQSNGKMKKQQETTLARIDFAFRLLTDPERAQTTKKTQNKKKEILGYNWKQ